MSANYNDNSLFVRALKDLKGQIILDIAALLSSAHGLLDHLSLWLTDLNTSDLKARQHRAACRTQNDIPSCDLSHQQVGTSS